jgi:hypothetical protein
VQILEMETVIYLISDLNNKTLSWYNVMILQVMKISTHNFQTSTMLQKIVNNPIKLINSILKLMMKTRKINSSRLKSINKRMESKKISQWWISIHPCSEAILKMCLKDAS